MELYETDRNPHDMGSWDFAGAWCARVGIKVDKNQLETTVKFIHAQCELSRREKSIMMV